MKTGFCISVSLSIWFASLPIMQAQAETKSVVTGNTSFAFDLYAQLKDVDGNLFFSPYSISRCMAMVYAGARGGTETQMSQVLHFNTDQSSFHSRFNALQRRLDEATNTVQLKIVNALWTRKGEYFLPDFLSIIREEYQATAHEADFHNHGQAAIDAINKWISRQTDGKIENMLSPGSVNEQTALVLANSIYFKGTWAYQFDPNETSTQPFYLSSTQQTNVLLMYEDDWVKVYETDEFQAIEKPYVGEGASMVILLPQSGTGLGALERIRVANTV